MNKELALKTKEHLLELLDWSNNNNRKLALECVNEIAETALNDINQWLKEEECCLMPLPINVSSLPSVYLEGEDNAND